MRDLLRCGGVLLLVATLILAGRSWSDTGGKSNAAAPVRPAKSKTSVAVINLTLVIRNYEKFKTYQEDMKATAIPFQIKEQAFKTEIDKLTREAADENITIKRRKQIDGRLKELVQAREANNTSFKQTIAQKQNGQLKVLYKDVQAATSQYAKAHGIDLVLQYNEPITPAEIDGTPNVLRKLQFGPLVPVYSAPGIDVSKEITAVLNENLRRKKEAL